MRGRAISAASRRRPAAIAPYLAFLGTVASGTTGTVTYPIPGGVAADDILLLPIECSDTGGITAPTGWAHVTNSPKAQGSNVTSISLLWKRATGSDTDPVVAGAINHQVGQIVVIRGCPTSGNPWDFVSTAGASGSTSFSHATSSTTADLEFLLMFAASSIDSATDQFGTFANSSVTFLVKENVAGTTNGNGGSVDILSASKDVAGSTGTWTATHNSGTWASICIAMKHV